MPVPHLLVWGWAEMDTVKAIEGIQPGDLWTFLYVLAGLAALLILGYKVVEIFRKEHERKTQRQAMSDRDITGDIADKVMDKLEPRLKSIEEKLQRDKNRLESHEVAISNIMDAQRNFQRGQEVMCQALMAVLDHELHNGNNDQMEAARNDLNSYLIHRTILQ